jgi:hypothetical protein
MGRQPAIGFVFLAAIDFLHYRPTGAAVGSVGVARQEPGAMPAIRQEETT